MKEAGYLGYLASREIQQQAMINRHEEYAKNPGVRTFLFYMCDFSGHNRN